MAGCSASLRAQLVNDGGTATLANVTNSIPGDVTVGTNGSFTLLTLLTLSDNALLTNSANGVIGRNASARSNEVRLTSPTARWLMGGDLSVGSNGAMNRLLVSNRAWAENFIGSLATGVQSCNNVALVTGRGSVWSNRASVILGWFGPNNQVIVSNGGSVVVGAGSTIGSQVSASGNVATVTGSGSVTNLTVTLSNLTLTGPNSIDMLLVSPSGQKVMFMSDVEVLPFSGLQLTFDDYAASRIPFTVPSTNLTSGTYRPLNLGTDSDPMPHPAPEGPYSSVLSSLNGSNPNGIWSLYFNADLIIPSTNSNLIGWSVAFQTDGGPGQHPGVFEFNGGTLNVTDIGADVLSPGDRFFLFDATPYVGGFATLNLPPLDVGLSWRNNLAVDGSIEVVAASQPGFASILRSGNNVILSGTNGPPNATYTVLASTNVAPLTNWSSIATRQFDASGNFSFTNAILPGIPQRFFLLRTP